MYYNNRKIFVRNKVVVALWETLARRVLHNRLNGILSGFYLEGFIFVTRLHISAWNLFHITYIKSSRRKEYRMQIVK